MSRELDILEHDVLPVQKGGGLDRAALLILWAFLVLGSDFVEMVVGK